jgi:hypothetical protein
LRSHKEPRSCECGWNLSNLHDVSNRSSLDSLEMLDGVRGGMVREPSAGTEGLKHCHMQVQ